MNEWFMENNKHSPDLKAMNMQRKEPFIQPGMVEEGTREGGRNFSLWACVGLLRGEEHLGRSSMCQGPSCHYARPPLKCSTTF